jgi:CheY-like chemotaxis protein
MKILAVDDDPIILELLTHFIAAIGEHDLQTALSGSEALQIVHQQAASSFDCFLFDIQMPDMDGIQLTRQIRSYTRYVDTPVIMLTAMSDKRYIDAAFSAGATDYVTKPFEVMELKERIGLVEGYIEQRKSRTSKVFAAKAVATSAQAETLELHQPISIYDVDHVIEYLAMQNYVAQLSRGALFGSTTFAFTIRKIDTHHAALSAFEFTSLVSDVAELISDTLSGHQFLMSYAGSGAFVCVTESGWRPNMKELMDNINLCLARSEFYNNKGEAFVARVSAGDAIRLIWKSGNSIMEAVGAAHASAEAASMAHERGLNDFWLVDKRA